MIFYCFSFRKKSWKSFALSCDFWNYALEMRFLRENAFLFWLKFKCWCLDYLYCKLKLEKPYRTNNTKHCEISQNQPFPPLFSFKLCANSPTSFPFYTSRPFCITQTLLFPATLTFFPPLELMMRINNLHDKLDIK